MSEKDLCDIIVAYLNMSGCYVWRNNAGLIRATTSGRERFIRLGQAGMSDILGIRKSDGKFIAIEVKLPKRRSTLTTLQSDYIDLIRRSHGLAGVATDEIEAKKIVEQV